MRYPPLWARVRAARLEARGAAADQALGQMESEMQDGDLEQYGAAEALGEWIDDEPDFEAED
jgi:hypothetical protein